MNPFQKIISCTPTMVTFLKGHQLFIKRKFSEANLKFEKCIKNPNFQNDLLFSLYGQSLCAVGRLQEGHNFLIKACEFYESEGWEFENQFAYDIASNCLNALRHTCHHLDLGEGEEYLDNKPKIKEK